MNRENILGIVLAHGGAAQACLRHEHVWLQSCDRLVYFTPCDNRLCLEHITQYSVGLNGRYSSQMNFRCREALRFASLTCYPYVALFEYDSMIFGEFPDMGNAGVMAPWMYNFEPQFRGRGYPHFPQLYTHDAVVRMVAALDCQPVECEGGFTDRYVGLGIQEAGLAVRDANREGLVFTDNEITRDRLDDALAAYRKGARWSHGIKDALVFEALESAAKAYTKAHLPKGA